MLSWHARRVERRGFTWPKSIFFWSGHFVPYCSHSVEHWTMQNVLRTILFVACFRVDHPMDLRLFMLFNGKWMLIREGKRTRKGCRKLATCFVLALPLCFWKREKREGECLPKTGLLQRVSNPKMVFISPILPSPASCQAPFPSPPFMCICPIGIVSLYCAFCRPLCVGSVSINRLPCESSWARGIFSCTWVVFAAHPRFCYKGRRSILIFFSLLLSSFSLSSSVYSTSLHPLHIYKDLLPFLCRCCLC